MRIPFRGHENNMKLTIRTDKRIQTIKQLVDNTNLFSFVSWFLITRAPEPEQITPPFFGVPTKEQIVEAQEAITHDHKHSTQTHTRYTATWLVVPSLVAVAGKPFSVFVRFCQLLVPSVAVCHQSQSRGIETIKTKLKQVGEEVRRRENKWEVKRKRCRTKAARWAESV